MTLDTDEIQAGDDGPRHWNYRVLNRTVETGVPGLEPVEEWVLIEAYYDAEDRIVAWCEAGAMASDVSLPDLHAEAKLRWGAIGKAAYPTGPWRVLTESDLPATGASEVQP